MKLFKNPVFAVILCLLLIVGSTCLNARFKMEKRYDRLFNRLCDEVLEYAEDNGIDELKYCARDVSSSGDYNALISSFNEFSSGHKHADTTDVDEAIQNFNRFLRKTQMFPAKMFVDLLHITF